LGQEMSTTPSSLPSAGSVIGVAAQFQRWISSH
jgi:hypothetical protein